LKNSRGEGWTRRKESEIAVFHHGGKTGLRLFLDVLDPGFRRGDGKDEFLWSHQGWSDAGMISRS
jgi:hypothetical protein